MLPPRRKSSVFRAPLREATLCRTRAEADDVSRGLIGKGVSAQAFGIYQKIREVDKALQLDMSFQERVFEVHPEVSFAAINGGAGFEDEKRSPSGQAQRTRLLEHVLGAQDPALLLRRNIRKSEVADDDILDACAALVTAKRIEAGEAVSFPDPPEVDSMGLRMAIWA
jgi:predicted RNase H-like nuclease